jgi:ABC-2 type transport system ATP-binding protein
MIKIENLNFGYSRKKILFEDMGHEFLPGHIYGLLGKNGAGKTTLLKHIAGLLFPQSGFCTVMGESSLTRKPSVLQEIFMVAEEFYLPSISIRWYVKINAPFYPHFDYDQFNYFMNEFDLNVTEKLTSLSYGQKKKVIIAFGLAANTKLLILDEPTNGLDIPSKSQFRRIIASSLNEERCIIISTHQVRDLSTLMDIIIIMEKGKLIFADSTELITRKLYFTETREPEENGNILYEERTGLSKKIIIPNKSGSESEVDLELFFNGILTNTESIINTLKN